MGDPFVFLDIDHDADERAIKRAYATRLRSTRPDADPVGFQALNEAYRIALEWARERDADAHHAAALSLVDSIGEPATIEAPAAAGPDRAAVAAAAQPMLSTEPVEVRWMLDPSALDERPGAPALDVPWQAPPPDAQRATPDRDDAREPPQEPLDFPAFFGALCEQAAHGDAEALGDWLQQQPALWSLSAKAQAGAATMSAVGMHAPPMPDRCFDVVLAFFDMDHVLAGQDALRLDRLRRRLHMEWLLLHGHRELAEGLRTAEPPVNLAIPRIFRLLSGPFRWPSVLFQGLPPNRPGEMATFLRHLRAARMERLPSGFDHRRVSFWMQAGNRGAMSLPRLAIGFARCVAIGLLAAIVDGMLSVLSGAPVMRLTALALAAFVLWLAYITWLALSEWQNLPQEALAASAASWRRLLFIPAIALAACANRYLLPNAADGNPQTITLVVSGLLVALAVVLAITRYRRRANCGPMRWFANYGGWRMLFFVPALKALVAVGAFVVYCIEAGATLAIAVWLADLWKQRAHLRGIS